MCTCMHTASLILTNPAGTTWHLTGNLFMVRNVVNKKPCFVASCAVVHVSLTVEHEYCLSYERFVELRAILCNSIWAYVFVESDRASSIYYYIVYWWWKEWSGGGDWWSRMWWNDDRRWEIRHKVVSGSMHMCSTWASCGVSHLHPCGLALMLANACEHLTSNTHIGASELACERYCTCVLVL